MIVAILAQDLSMSYSDSWKCLPLSQLVEWEWSILNHLQSDLCKLGGRSPLSQLAARAKWGELSPIFGKFNVFLEKHTNAFRVQEKNKRGGKEVFLADDPCLPLAWYEHSLHYAGSTFKYFAGVYKHWDPAVDRAFLKIDVERQLAVYHQQDQNSNIHVEMKPHQISDECLVIQWPWGLSNFRLKEGLGLVEKGRYLWQAVSDSKQLVGITTAKIIPDEAIPASSSWSGNDASSSYKSRMDQMRKDDEDENEV